MFLLSFKNGNDDPTRNSFNKYYMKLVEIKDFNALIGKEPFFDQPVKNKQEAYEKLIEMSRNDDYATGNLLNDLYHQKYYNIIGIDLSRQKNTNIPQQVNLCRKIRKTWWCDNVFIAEKHQKTILHFSLDSLIVTE